MTRSDRERNHPFSVDRMHKAGIMSTLLVGSGGREESHQEVAGNLHYALKKKKDRLGHDG